MTLRVHNSCDVLKMTKNAWQEGTRTSNKAERRRTFLARLFVQTHPLAILWKKIMPVVDVTDQSASWNCRHAVTLSLTVWLGLQEDCSQLRDDVFRVIIQVKELVNL